MRVVDFFCGGGGFSEGFRQAGFEIIFAVDKWNPAVMTYKGNKPSVNIIQDDVIRISELNDKEFENLVPDSEVIIGSPPCQAFSQSNKSGNGDKKIGIQLINAYLRIVARKKYKNESILKYWILENVPNVQNYIQSVYTAEDLGLPGNFMLETKDESAGIYNAKYFGAPTNRKRYLCGEFPVPMPTHTNENVKILKDVLKSLGEPLSDDTSPIQDINYPGFSLAREDVSDQRYLYELQPFEWKTAKRLKEDRGYMGKMSFPENLDAPARTVLATMSASSRESMILGFGNNQYRLPTVREVASMMSFPIDYKFYGTSKGIKYTLVGNAVAPKMSYALAKAIAEKEEEVVPQQYIPIQHNREIPFYNLNGIQIPIKEEKLKREVSKFKYHIPYLIISKYRVELTNYHSDFEKKSFKWDVEIHYSQGKKTAAFFIPQIREEDIPNQYREPIQQFINNYKNYIVSFTELQKMFCMTSIQRQNISGIGPFELLELVKSFIIDNISGEKQEELVSISDNPKQLPSATLVGYYILKKVIEIMGGIK